MEIEITPVSVDRIDTADHTFKITTNTDTNDLTSSIGSVGLLQPPILMPTAKGYRTVTGFRRIAACEGLNLTPIAARLLPPDTSPMVCAQMAVADNALQRPLNLIEQSRAYALLNRLAGHS
ncbi:MAG: ParB N-terminal domain-containing protein, partial [Desulfosarcina sp.]